MRYLTLLLAFIAGIIKPEPARAFIPNPGLCRDQSGGNTATNPVLTRLYADRETQIRFVDETLSRVESEERDLVDAERNNLTAARERIQELDAQIEPLEAFEELRGAHRQTGARYTSPGGGEQRPAVRTEPRGHEYRSAGEIIVDRIHAHDGRAEAVERLESAGIARDLGGQARALVHQTTGDTPGLLPEPIIGAIESDVDAARPFLSSIGVKSLSGIPGKTFERPIVTQHTQVGKQAAEKDVLASRKLIIGSVPFTRETYGGALNVSRQEIDWTSPAAWDAIIRDLQEQYALETENAAADAFVTSVVEEVELAAAIGATPTLAQLAAALYSAASTSYGGTGRLPNHVWMSLDMWALYGPVLDTSPNLLRAPGNESSVSSFEGRVMDLPRTVVPSFPAGTVIVGQTNKVEAYEERIGLLQAVQPSVLGVEIAYGGYVANGTINPDGFAKIINEA